MAKKVRILADDVEKNFLPFVRKPARYIGGEINQIKKDLTQCDFTIALCFPDIYEIAMSHTGLSIIYHVLNEQENIAAERAFAPWTDAEDIMRQKDIPLFTLESKAAVADFDIVGFSLTNEMCCTNMLNMLDLAGIPLRTSDRNESHPLIIAGGQSANCAEPIADFVDIFILGEAEYAIIELVELLRKQRRKKIDRNRTLIEVAKNLSFAYVPSLYTFEYEGDKIKSFTPTIPGLPTRFENAVVDDLDSAPVPHSPIVPFVQPVHERISVEIMRGCPGRCRFCQASFCRRPLRFRSPERVFEIAKQNYLATGLDTVGLLSLSSADYPHLEELVEKLQGFFTPLHVGVSLPSLKVQAQLKLLPKLVTSVRKSGLTIAVEAATEPLRKIINKPITDDDLLGGIAAAFEAGFGKIKLYFMVGLPGEAEEDIKQIVHLSNQIALLRKQVDRKIASVNITISFLVPKPHTPFQWLGQKGKDYFHNARSLILDEKKKLNARSLQFKFHHIETSILESAVARGDRRLCSVIERAFRLGAKFDLWTENFDYQIWQKAFAENNLDLEAEAVKTFLPDDILPWDHLGGPNKQTLLKHYKEVIDLI